MKTALAIALVALSALSARADELAAAPEAAAPEAAAPEAAVPEAAVPEAAVPEAAVPEAAVPEAAVPEAAVPEAAVPEAAVPEAAVPEAAVPEAAVPEAAVPEAAVPEAAVPEAAVPEAAAKGAEVAPEAAVAVAVTPCNFCGQHLVAGLLLKTEIGQQLQREQNAAMEQALLQYEASVQKQPTLPELPEPPAEGVKVQAAEALSTADMPRGIDGKRLQHLWLPRIESGAELQLRRMAALIETDEKTKRPSTFARSQRKMASDPFKVWSMSELQAHLETRTRILNAPEGMGLGLK